MAQVRQYTPKERNVLCMAYQKYKGKGKCYQKVVNEFSGSFPQARVPNVSTVIRIWSKQQEHSTVHNLNSMQSPGDTYSGRPKTARSQGNI